VSLLTPWSALLAAAVAVPLLVLLYFLKLRRQPLRIASTLLWRKSFEDLQVNAPFQRPRWSLLLLLQLLLLLAVLGALAQPVLRGEALPASRVVLVIDASASMNAMMPAADSSRQAETRLDAAKRAASETVDRLSRSNVPAQIMVLSFGSSAQVVSGFETNRSAVLNAIDSIPPTDEPADLDAALQLAGAYAGQRDEADEQPPDVLLYSDGCVGEPGTGTSDAGGGAGSSGGGFAIRAGRFRFIQIVQSSEPTNNLGIVAFSALRDDDDPTQVHIFGRLLNAGAEPVETVVTLSANDQPVTLIRRTVLAATEAGPGEEGVSATIALDGGAVLKLSHNHRDQLAVDNEALLVMNPPARPRIVVVYPEGGSPDAFLKNMLEELDPQALTVLSSPAFEAIDAQQIDSGALYDLIVFDRVSPARLPWTPTLTIGATLPGVTLKESPGAAGGGRMILSWDRQHPLMRHVSLDTILFTDFGGFELPTGALPLAFGPDGPVIAMLRSRGARHVAVGFELMNSNWPWHVSSAVFLKNAVELLTLDESGAAGVAYQPGQPITLRAAAGATELIVQGPDVIAVRVPSAAGGGRSVTIPALQLAGLYTIQGAAPPQDRLALSVVSDVESDIRPRHSITVNSETQASATVSSAAPRELWPWLAGAALMLLVMEWLLWCRRTAG
jgi:hypothetical protein